MHPTKINKLNIELRKLLDIMRSVIGAMIVDHKGLLITSHLPREIDEREFGAIALSLHKSLETAVESFKEEEVAHISVEMDDLQILMMMNDKILLATIAKKINADLGMILIEMEQLLTISGEII